MPKLSVAAESTGLQKSPTDGVVAAAEDDPTGGVVVVVVVVCVVVVVVVVVVGCVVVVVVVVVGRVVVVVVVGSVVVVVVGSSVVVVTGIVDGKVVLDSVVEPLDESRARMTIIAMNTMPDTIATAARMIVRRGTPVCGGSGSSGSGEMYSVVMGPDDLAAMNVRTLAYEPRTSAKRTDAPDRLPDSSARGDHQLDAGAIGIGQEHEIHAGALAGRWEQSPAELLEPFDRGVEVGHPEREVGQAQLISPPGRHTVGGRLLPFDQLDSEVAERDHLRDD